MTNELNNQWRRLYAAGKVRWMPGMLALGHSLYPDGFRVQSIDTHGGLRLTMGDHSLLVEAPNWSSHARLVPDLTDSATLGCLLAMAREATGDATMTHSLVPGVLMDGVDVWCIIVPGVKGMPAQASTEAGALLAAIEVA